LDFINKLSISLKEAEETKFWLNLLHDTDYIDDDVYSSIYEDCHELLKLLTSIIKSSKNNLK
jgi:four helix bundle protein